MKKKSKKNKKKLLILRLVFVFFLVVSNTFAWFIYITRVDNSVNVHVKSWDVTFQSGEHEISNNVVVDIENLYPGMEDFNYEIKAFNRSEVSATLSYTILEARIFEDEYVTVEGREINGDDPVATDLTSAQLESKLRTEYPFTIRITLSNETIDSENGNELFTLGAVWPYESGDDELDTEWGIRAATYKKQHPTLQSITLKIRLDITQNPE